MIISKIRPKVKSGAGIGKFIAAEIASYGYECRADVGASDFKIDVAVVDPKNKHRFILAVVCDGTNAFSVKDRNLLQVLSLRRGNWNVVRVNSVSYFNNPKREIKRIKDVLDRLTGRQIRQALPRGKADRKRNGGVYHLRRERRGNHGAAERDRGNGRADFPPVPEKAVPCDLRHCKKRL